jgi:hypothetical protein
MFFVCVGHECRHAFVQPKVIPIAARHHNAPPLMREFVRAEPHVALIF